MSRYVYLDEILGGRVQKTPENGLFRIQVVNNVTEFQVKNVDTGKWHPVYFAQPITSNLIFSGSGVGNFDGTYELFGTWAGLPSYRQTITWYYLAFKAATPTTGFWMISSPIVDDSFSYFRKVGGIVPFPSTPIGSYEGFGAHVGLTGNLAMEVESEVQFKIGEARD